jgi:hypothetical protein
MKRFVLVAALALLCIASPTVVDARGAKSTVDMSKMDKIFVGWVDFDPAQYRVLDYDTKKEWSDVIDQVNATFQDDLKTKYLAGRTLTMAKNREDVDTAGNDLYIKFTNASEDKGYRLHIAVHFIDPKTNTELAVIPENRYGAHVCGLVGCMEKELDKVGELINKQVGPVK